MRTYTIKLTEEHLKEVLYLVEHSGGEGVTFYVAEALLEQLVEQDAPDDILDEARDAYNAHFARSGVTWSQIEELERAEKK